MVNFGSIPRFLPTQRHLGTAPDRACLFCTNFSSTCIYRRRRHTWGKQGCYERIAHGGKMKTKKGRKQRETESRARLSWRGGGGRGWEGGPPGRTRASRLSWTGNVEQGRSCCPGAFSSVLMYLRYPRRGLNVYHNPVATTTTRLKLFLHNIPSNQPAISAPTAGPAEKTRRRRRTALTACAKPLPLM